MESVTISDEKNIHLDSSSSHYDSISQLQTQKHLTNIKLLTTQILDIHPACLEFPPAELSTSEYSFEIRKCAREYFVVGTYELAEETRDVEKLKDGTQERVGGISLFNLDGGKLTHKQTHYLPHGIYDIKFLPNHLIFAASSTVGSISIFALQPSTSPPSSSLELKHVTTHQVFSEEDLIISLAWHPGPTSSKSQILLATTSNGGLYALKLTSDFLACEFLYNETPIYEHILKTRYFENTERVWCCAFSSPIPNSNQTQSIAFSGGDDCFLRASPLNIHDAHTNSESKQDGPVEDVAGGLGEEIGDGGEEESKLKFPAGVTAILPLPILDPQSYTLLIGSYDNHIHLITFHPAPQTPSEPAFQTHLSLNLGGGVYRLRFMHPYPPLSLSSASSPDSNRENEEEATWRVLACCMHAGTKILSVTRSKREGKEWEWKIKVLAEMNDNDSMCYAADVQPLPVLEDGDGDSDEGGLEGKGNGREMGREKEKRVCVSSSWQDSKLSVWEYDPGET